MILTHWGSAILYLIFAQYMYDLKHSKWRNQSAGSMAHWPGHLAWIVIGIYKGYYYTYT